MDQFTKVLVVVAVACLTIVQSQVSFESCSMQCGASTLGNAASNTHSSTFRIGKQGPKGEKGEKGTNAEQCECNDVAELAQKVSLLQRALLKTCEDTTIISQSASSGIYTIFPFKNKSAGLEVFCDFETDGGVWLVFQRRVDGTENFFRNFSDYVTGFGNPKGEFWLGLDSLHKLTKNGEYELRIDMEDFDGNMRYAFYSNFLVGAGTDYELTVGGYSGDAGDSLSSYSGQKFSAKDLDQDTRSSASCALLYKGGWWYSNCHSANLNGLYLGGNHDSYADGVNWQTWLGYNYSLKKVEMKLRKK
ncbi:unnamed protein product [Clavelina lepadiformis]|uniref:Fibrinogen C-terminal domain-containing protein n=1 Tax=Clavelina lepadiformis TaxID=159417 RepID=A0ABP0GSL9_CLALP